jgi:hypothetical protein
MNGTALNTLVSSIFSILLIIRILDWFETLWLRLIALNCTSSESRLTCTVEILVAAFPFILPITTEYEVSHHERFFETLYSR